MRAPQMSKIVVVLVLLAAAMLIAASVRRSVVSRERAVVDAHVVRFEPQPGDEARNLPFGGTLTSRLADGRTIAIDVPADIALKPGAAVRLSERIAPWGEVWYRLAD